MWHRRLRSVKRDYSRKSYSNPMFRARIQSAAALRRRLWTLAVAAAAAGWIWFIVFSGMFRIETIEVRGNDQIAGWEFRDAVKDVLAEKKWLVLPGDNLLLLSEEDLKRRLNDRFVLESLEIAKRPPRTLDVELRERVSSILMQMPDGSQATLGLDGQVIRTYAPSEAVDLYVPIGPSQDAGTSQERPKLYVLYNDRIETASQRERAVGPEVIQAVIELPKLIAKPFGMSAAGVEIHVDGKAGGTIRAVTPEGWSIYIDAGKPLKEQIDNADLVVSDKVGADRPRLDYVDVRFGEKVFFKLR